MKTTYQCVLATFALLALTVLSYASHAGEQHINAGEVTWTAPPESYSGEEFADAFRYKTLVGGQSAPVQGEGVRFGEADWAPGAIYVGHKHPSPEIYYVISGEAEWTVDGETFRATPGTVIYAKPNAVHRMVNVGDSVLKTVWMWYGEPDVLNQFPEIVEPIEEQPAEAKFAD